MPSVVFPLAHAWNPVPGGTLVAANRLIESVVDEQLAEVMIVTPAGDPPNGPLPSVTPLARATHVARPPLLYDLWRTFGRPDPQRVAARSRFSPDIVHFTAPIVPNFNRVRRGSGPALVATVHDLVALTDPDLLTPRGARLMAASLASIRECADAVICSSEQTRADCLEAGFEPARLHVVHLGVAPAPSIDSAGLSAAAQLRAIRGSSRPFVLWVGSREPRKNLGAVITLADPLDKLGYDLVIVGPDGWGGADARGGELQAFSESVGVGAGQGQDGVGAHANVSWLGYVPDRTLSALYQTADLFVFPSFKEGFGLPILEAMAAGTPVVTSSGSATEEAAGGAARLCDPRSPTQLRAAVIEVLTNSAESARLSAAGAERAAAMSWAIHAQKVAAVWAAALRDGGGSSDR